MAQALIPVAATGGEVVGAQRGMRPRAAFVAQLIATLAQVPQTRARRRADQAEASAAYRALGQWPTFSGQTLSRTL